jgi:hypothetical protein
MKTRLNIIVSALAVLLFSGIAQAQTQDEDVNDGNFLLVSCHLGVRSLDRTEKEAPGPADAFRAGYCMGLVAGVASVAQQSSHICPLHGVGNGQMVRVVTKFLEDRPKALHLPGFVLVEMALGDAFPCSKKTK